MMQRKIKLLLIIFLIFGAFLNATTYSPDNQLDINKATLSQIKELPISEKLAKNIYNYLLYEDYFHTVYDLMNVKGMDSATFLKIKPLVAVYPFVGVKPVFERVERYYYKISQWAEEEGGNSSIVDDYIDMIRHPVNVNNITEEKLLNFQNVSPIDAAAIIRYLHERGKLRYQRQLRSINGLSHYAYVNLRKFLVYSDEINADKNLGIDYQFRMDNDFSLDDVSSIFLENDVKVTPAGVDSSNWYERLNLMEANPSVQHKVRFTYKNDYKGGFLVFRNWGESANTKHYKYFAGMQNLAWGNFQLHNLILGHYRVSFGQGLVMDNTDYFSPRRTGYGYGVRMHGIVGDLSKTDEYALRGIAAEWSFKNLYSIFFLSNDKKDAILDENGQINNYILLSPTISNDVLNYYGISSMRDVVTETTWGGFLKYKFTPGNYIGISGYESLYDNYWSEKKVNQIASQDKTTTTDLEYLKGFSNNDGKYRHVLGMEFGTVYKNMTINGEVAKLFDVDNGLAYVISGYWRFDNFNFLVLYRDIDVDFDNPYNRAFSEKEHFNNTILEKPYYLKTPLYGELFTNSVQPQPEKGLAIQTRFQISRTLTLSKLYYDIYQTNADGKLYDRFEMKLNYSPVRNIRFSFYKKLLRGLIDNTLNTRTYYTNSNIFSFSINLTGFDRIQFDYWTGYVDYPDRLKKPFVGSYVDTNDGYDLPTRGEQRGENKGIMIKAYHNIGSKVRVVLGGGLWYGGGFYSFDASLFDNMDQAGKKIWVQIRDRVSDNLAVSFFARFSNYDTQTSYVRNKYQTLQTIYPKIGWNRYTYRIQMDYSW